MTMSLRMLNRISILNNITKVIPNNVIILEIHKIFFYSLLLLLENKNITMIWFVQFVKCNEKTARPLT